MPEFASLHSYQKFEQSVKCAARFVLEDAARAFLTTVLETAEQRLSLVRSGECLFRAQRGFVPTTVTLRMPSFADGDEEYAEEEVEVHARAALPAERMVPKVDYVGDGRVNPRGIPCLYLASTLSAVISEMRPWVGSYITIAEFKTVRDCRLVDCSLSTTESWLLESTDPERSNEEPDANTRENGVWGDIGFAFSKPVTRDEPQLDYIPTQILAEAFRSRGYDGIIYKSLLDKDGKNIALFDLSAAKLTSRQLYKTHSASFECITEDPVHDGYRARAKSSWPNSISSHFVEMPPF
jgi:hypothetical protein